MHFYRFPVHYILLSLIRNGYSNQPLVSYPPSRMCVCLLKVWGLGSFNYTLQRGLLQLSSSLGDEFLTFHCVYIQGSVVTDDLLHGCHKAQSDILDRENCLFSTYLS